MKSFFDDLIESVQLPVVTDKLGQFWVQDDPVLDTDGRIIRGGMWQHQRDLWNLPNFVKVLVGGYGAGKTLIGCKRAISLALENAPAPVAVISPTFPIARQTCILTINELLEGKRQLYGNKFWYNYNKSTHHFKIRFRGRDATILIYSGDTPKTLKGPNLAAALIDEPFIQDQEVLDQMIARIRHPDARCKELMLTGTPEELNWGYDLCEGELNDRFDVGVIHGATYLNQVVGNEYVNRLTTAYDDKAVQAYVEGQFVNLATGLVYHQFNKTLHVRELDIPEAAELGAGMDFNVNPMSASVFWKAGDRVHFFDEIELPNSDTEYMCELLQDRYKGRIENIYPDASGSARKTAAPTGRTDFWYIKDAGFHIKAKKANPKRRDRYNAMNGMLKQKYADGSPKVTFSPKCKNLVKYMGQYSHEKMNKQENMSHLLDATTYPVSFLFPVDRKRQRRMVDIQGY